MSTEFDILLARSDAFTQHLFLLAAQFGTARNDSRARPAAAACELSLEHAQALRILLTHSAANAACALLRVQYEALLRGSWILYAASDVEVDRAGADLTPDAQRSAQSLANAKAMLSDLERALAAQPGLVGLVQPLQEIRKASWTAMNSFVHAGLHPLQRKEEGFPLLLAEQVVRHSNAMMHLAVRLLYRLCELALLHPSKVERAYVGFEDCLPIAPPP